MVIFIESLPLKTKENTRHAFLSFVFIDYFCHFLHALLFFPSDTLIIFELTGSLLEHDVYEGEKEDPRNMYNKERSGMESNDAAPL